MDPLFHWPSSMHAAVSLTYDDGLPIHPALVGPTLQQHGIPVIVMPAVAAALELFAWFQAASYLRKPFGVDEVLARIAPLCPPPRSRP
jgi:DNA-binding response OmpR family regulator